MKLTNAFNSVMFINISQSLHVISEKVFIVRIHSRVDRIIRAEISRVSCMNIFCRCWRIVFKIVLAKRSHLVEGVHWMIHVLDGEQCTSHCFPVIKLATLASCFENNPRPAQLFCLTSGRPSSQLCSSKFPSERNKAFLPSGCDHTPKSLSCPLISLFTNAHRFSFTSHFPRKVFPNVNVSSFRFVALFNIRALSLKNVHLVMTGEFCLLSSRLTRSKAIDLEICSLSDMMITTFYSQS